MKRTIKYGLGILLIVFIGYESVYFKKLNEVLSASSSKTFNPDKYARDFYAYQLIPRQDSAIDLGRLLTELKTNPEKTFNAYSHALDIGNIRYFLVKGEGTVSTVSDDAVGIILKNYPGKTDVNIATEFVYGNALRDASGLIHLNEFTNTTDFNNISESINQIVRKEVLPSFKAIVKPRKQVKIFGAIELNRAHVNLDSIEVQPIQLSVLNP